MRIGETPFCDLCDERDELLAWIEAADPMIRLLRVKAACHEDAERECDALRAEAKFAGAALAKERRHHDRLKDSAEEWIDDIARAHEQRDEARARLRELVGFFEQHLADWKSEGFGPPGAAAKETLAAAKAHLDGK